MPSVIFRDISDNCVVRLRNAWLGDKGTMQLIEDSSLIITVEDRVKPVKNHYQWLDKNWIPFITQLRIDPDRSMCGNGMITAHGDKCYGYEGKWKEAGIPFEHGVALYLLSHISPWKQEVGQTENGWVKVDDWIVKNYYLYKHLLERASNLPKTKRLPGSHIS